MTDRVKLFLEEIVGFNFSHSGCETEVCDYQFAFFVDQQIFRFYISMDDSVSVQVFDPFYKLVKYVLAHCVVKPVCVLNEAIDFSVLCQLHNVVANALFPLQSEILCCLEISWFRRFNLFVWRILSVFIGSGWVLSASCLLLLRSFRFGGLTYEGCMLLLNLSAIKAGVKDLHDIWVPALSENVDLSKEAL